MKVRYKAGLQWVGSELQLVFPNIYKDIRTPINGQKRFLKFYEFSRCDKLKALNLNMLNL